MIPIRKPEPPQGQAGVTLIELVVTIVIIGVAVSGVFAVIGTGSRNSANTQLQIKAVELAQSYMDEIYAKKWDENTKNGGGCVWFSSETNCEDGDDTPDGKCPGDCGPDDSMEGHTGDDSRSHLNDVDDYHGLCEGACGADDCSDDEAPDADHLRDAAGAEREKRYQGFCVTVEVVAGAGEDLLNVPPKDAKRITVTVIDPQDNKIPFSTYRLNF